MSVCKNVRLDMERLRERGEKRNTCFVSNCSFCQKEDLLSCAH